MLAATAEKAQRGHVGVLLSDVYRLMGEMQLEGGMLCEAELAFLVYNHSRYAHLVIPALDSRDVGVNETAIYLAGVEEAMRILQRATARGGSLGHPGREAMTVNDSGRVLESWERTASRLQQASEAALAP